MILFVDDHAAVRELAEMVLTVQGYRVLLAANGTEALNLTAQHAGGIRVVVTDLVMPSMDGIALIRALREADRPIKIIASTAVDLKAPGQLDQLKALGVSGILAKPYTTEKLLLTLNEVLKES